MSCELMSCELVSCELLSCALLSAHPHNEPIQDHHEHLLCMRDIILMHQQTTLTSIKPQLMEKPD